MEHLAEWHTTFRVFIDADIDRIFVGVIVSCRFAITVVAQPVAQSLRQHLPQPLRLDIGDDLQTPGTDLTTDRPRVLGMRGRRPDHI
jgi:hypothetical protein